MPSQDSLTDQMQRTLERAVAAGDYDAADWIERRWQQPLRPSEPSEPSSKPLTRGEQHERHMAKQPLRPSADELAEAARQNAEQRGRELRAEQDRLWKRLPDEARARIGDNGPDCPTCGEPMPTPCTNPRCPQT